MIVSFRGNPGQREAKMMAARSGAMVGWREGGGGGGGIWRSMGFSEIAAKAAELVLGAPGGLPLTGGTPVPRDCPRTGGCPWPGVGPNTVVAAAYAQ